MATYTIDIGTKKFQRDLNKVQKSTLAFVKNSEKFSKGFTASRIAGIKEIEAQQAESLKRQSRNYRRFADEARRALSFLSVDVVLRGAANFTRNLVSVASETEKTRATLSNFTDDVEGLFDRLQDASKDLINIDVSQFTKQFVAFRAAGATVDDATQIIRGFSIAAAALGKGADETTRAMRQLTQSFSVNKIEGDDVKSIIEVLPNFLQIASKVLNTNIQSWKQLNSAIEKAGLTVREFYTQVGGSFEANIDLNLDTYSAQSALLTKELANLSREIGEKLLPLLTGLAKEARTTITIFSDTKGIRNFAIAMGGAGIATVAITRSINVFRSFALIQLIGTVSEGTNAARLFSATLAKNMFPALVGATSRMQAFKAAIITTKISAGAFLGIITATTAAIGYFAVKAEIAKNTASAFAKTLAVIGEGFNLGKKDGGFDTGSLAQIQSALNKNLDEQNRLTTQIALNYDRIRSAGGGHGGGAAIRRARAENEVYRTQLNVMLKLHDALLDVSKAKSAKPQSPSFTPDFSTSALPSGTDSRTRGLLPQFDDRGVPSAIALSIDASAQFIVSSVSDIESALARLRRQASARPPKEGIVVGEQSIIKSISGINALGAELSRYFELQQKEAQALNRIDAQRSENIDNLARAREAYNGLRREYDSYINSLKVRPSAPDSDTGVPSAISLDTTVDALQQVGKSVGEVGQGYVDARQKAEDFSNIATAFANNFSSSLTSLVFDSNRDFKEIFNSFLRASVQIVSQALIEFNIRRKLSDDLTNHIIANNSKIAVSSGSLSLGVGAASAAASASPVGGAIVAGISAVQIASTLYRAVKDGYQDAAPPVISMDKRVVSKQVSGGLDRLAREGRVRL